MVRQERPAIPYEIMFTHATPASPTSAITNSTVVPSSPSRPSRLRGLSYLRNYTHNLHSSSHSRESATTSPTSPNSRHSLTRATSYPQPGSPTANENIRNQESPLATPTGDGDTSMTMEGPMRTFVPSGIMNPVDSGLHAAVMAATSPTTTTAAAAPVRAASQTNGVRQSESNPELRHVNVNGATPSPPPASERESKATIRFTMHQDPRAPRPSLQFSPMGRTLPTGKEIIKVGRYSERETAPNQPANLSTAAPVGFKSKVVSRRHCEFWVEDGQWYIKDVKSSSGTFLNHVRLSSPNTESKPFPVRDGDIVQLGIDFKGGEEMIFRCVKIRVEINRGWQAGLNQFNVATHKRLRNMVQSSGGDAGGNSSDCTICLAPVAVSSHSTQI